MTEPSHSTAGAPARPSRFDRVCNAIMHLGVAWFTLVAGWGMFGTIGGGHYAAAAGVSLSTENMILWKIIAPVWEYTAIPPLQASYYCHHPFGCFWLQIPTVGIFGHHDWIVYFPAVVMSGLTAFFIGRTARNAWGPLGGAAATLGFVTLPITMAFANYPVLEVVTMFGWSMFFWGHSAMLKTWKKRYIALSVVGAVIAVNGDWAGYFAPGVFLAWTLFRGFILPQRIVEKIKTRPYAQWWALSASVVFSFLVFWMILFYIYGKIGDLFSFADVRGAGSRTLKELLTERAYRIEVMFTPPVILLGKLMVPVAIVRLLVKRKDAEIISLAALIAATVQFVAFKQGAYIHIFWPHYFGFYFAFAFAQFAVSARWIFEKLFQFALYIARRIRPALTQAWHARGGQIVGLGLAGLFILGILPDSLHALRAGRETWGRYNEEKIRSDSDVFRTLEALSPRVDPDTQVSAHASLGWGWHLSWALHGLHTDVHSLPSREAFQADERAVPLRVPRASPFWVARASGFSGADLERLTKEYFVEFYGDVLVVDVRRAPAPLDAYTWEEHEPNIFEWYLFGGTEPRVKLTRDPFATWEWRTMLGQEAEAPSEAPVTLDQKRIAYNIAIDAGDAPRAAALRQEIFAELSEDLTADFTQGVKLVGTRRIGGTSPRFELWFEASQPIEGDAQFGVHSKMIANSAGWSVVSHDELYRDLTLPALQPASRWKKGHLYTHQFVLYHRIGQEKYDGIFWSRDGKPAPGLVGRERETLDLLVVD